MPPKLKRARTAGPSHATSIADVPKVQLGLRDWVHHVHSLRHVDPDSAADGEPEMGVKGWPGLKGGTFRSVAQQAWAHRGKLFQTSLELLQKAGFMDLGTTVEDLGLIYMKLKVPASS
jgi:hypothetical protein